MNYSLFHVNKNTYVIPIIHITNCITNYNVNSRSDPRASFHVPLDFGILL